MNLFMYFHIFAVSPCRKKTVINIFLCKFLQNVLKTKGTLSDFESDFERSFNSFILKKKHFYQK